VTAGLEVLRAEAERRLSPSRLAHVEAVAETAGQIATAGAWSAATVERALRAAWIHDVLKDESVGDWVRVIEEVGWEPDPWALAYNPQLLHAQAAAAWAQSCGEVDREVLEAVRYHPTAHPDWDVVGLILFVADFAEPTRRFAKKAGTAEIRATASRGAAGLAVAARRVLGLRMGRLLESGDPVHPISIDAWNAWATEATGR
jgi:HD superfamily phosphohydrolase YqeK